MSGQMLTFQSQNGGETTVAHIKLYTYNILYQYSYLLILVTVDQWFTRGRHGRSGLPKLSHFSLFQAQEEVVLHLIYRIEIILQKTNTSLQNYKNGQNFSLLVIILFCKLYFVIYNYYLSIFLLLLYDIEPLFKDVDVILRNQ